jgi:aarF domain-containing kinase
LSSALVIRAISVLEGIALVGNPNFAIIDEAYPYIARRLMTDRSPRLQAALRYMIYGRDGVFDAENAIDLLQALEKFKSVRDDGDGTSFKVNGVRGSKVVGSAGDFRGSQVVDTSDRDASNRFRISTSTNGSTKTSASTGRSIRQQPLTQQPQQTQNDQQTVREALRFFFSNEGTVFREFMLEEIVNVVDASGRGAIQELSRSLGLNNFPIPGFVRALNPEVTEKDRTIVQQIRILFNFLMGDYSDTSITSSTRLRQLLPVAREYATQLRDFGLLLGVRLTEKNLSRGMNWATDQLAQQQSSQRQRHQRILSSSSSPSSSTASNFQSPVAAAVSSASRRPFTTVSRM